MGRAEPGMEGAHELHPHQPYRQTPGSGYRLGLWLQ